MYRAIVYLLKEAYYMTSQYVDIVGKCTKGICTASTDGERGKKNITNEGHKTDVIIPEDIIAMKYCKNYMSIFDAQPTDDSWLEKRNFEQMLVRQPELLRAKMRKVLNECEFLKKNIQIDEEARSDLVARLQEIDAVARKLHSFEDWELSVFGTVLTNNGSDRRISTMIKFLNKYAKDDDRALEVAENFRTIWGILPTSDSSLISTVAREYSNEISALGNCVYRWCEYHIVEVPSVNTKYLDLAVNAGLVSMAEPQQEAICVGYAKWRATFDPPSTTQRISKMRTLNFLPETSGTKAFIAAVKTVSASADEVERIFTSTVEESFTEQVQETRRDLPVPPELDAVARKLRAFENWELSVFGYVLTDNGSNHRIPKMKIFLKKYMKKNNRTLEEAEKFRTVWGILPTSNPSLVPTIAREYFKEISALANCVRKWYEDNLIEVPAMNTTYLDLAVNAGLVSMAEPQQNATYVSYTKREVTFNLTSVTERFTERVQETTMEKVQKSTAKPKKKVTKGEDANYYMDSGGSDFSSSSEEECPGGVRDGFKINKTSLRLLNWH